MSSFDCIKGLFKQDFNRQLSFDENEYIPWTGDSSIFSEFPTEYLDKNFDGIYDEISNTDGLKIRVPFSEIGQIVNLSKILPMFCDHVIFSPAPLYTSCGHLWSELSYMMSGSGDTFISDIKIFSLLASARPLVEKGDILFLPFRGGFQRWNYPKLKLPRYPCLCYKNLIKDADTDVPEFIKPLIEEDPFLAEGLLQLYLDNLVSNELGCIHALPATTNMNFAISDLSAELNNNELDNFSTNEAYALLNLRIPYVENISYVDLAKLKEEEYDSFKAFRNSIVDALDEINDSVENNSNVDRQVARIQRYYIDEPLHDLDYRLEQLTKYQSYRMAGYSLASTSMILASTLGEGVFKTAAQAIGAVSVIQIYEKLIEYLERKSELKNNSIFFALKAKKLGERSKLV